MIISDRLLAARKRYTCGDCRKPINTGDKYHRLFGSAEPEDPKYEMMVCRSCHLKTEELQGSTNGKIR